MQPTAIDHPMMLINLAEEDKQQQSQCANRDGVASSHAHDHFDSQELDWIEPGRTEEEGNPEDKVSMIEGGVIGTSVEGSESWDYSETAGAAGTDATESAVVIHSQDL